MSPCKTMSSRPIGISLALGLTVLLAIAATSAPRSRKFRGTYVGTIAAIPEGASSVDVWLPIPSDSAQQLISDVKIEAPGRVTTSKDSAGNSVAHFTLKKADLVAGKETEVRVLFTAVRHEELFPAAIHDRAVVAPRDVRAFLLPNRLVPITPRVRKMAQELSVGAPDAVAKARAFFTYLVDNGTYDKTTPGWGRGDSERFCDVKKGNCTDFHSLFIALARAEKIPVRFEIGFPLKPEKEGSVPGYHCWAQFFVKGRGWVAVDASDAAKSSDPERRRYLFGNLDPDRVEFSTGRDLTLAPAQKGGPLNFLIYPYVEVDGKAFSETKIRFEYRDV